MDIRLKLNKFIRLNNKIKNANNELSMGSATKGICECGYISDDIRVGGGMDTFTMFSYFPCLCVDCEEIVEVNVMEGSHKIKDWDKWLEAKNRGLEIDTEVPLDKRQFKCQKCEGLNVILYNDERLIGELGDKKLISWYDQSLTNGTYHCPKCNKMLLKFLPSFRQWD